MVHLKIEPQSVGFASRSSQTELLKYHQWIWVRSPGIICPEARCDPYNSRKTSGSLRCRI